MKYGLIDLLLKLTMKLFYFCLCLAIKHGKPLTLEFWTKGNFRFYINGKRKVFQNLKDWNHFTLVTE